MASPRAILHYPTSFSTIKLHPAPSRTIVHYLPLSITIWYYREPSSAAARYSAPFNTTPNHLALFCTISHGNTPLLIIPRHSAQYYTIPQNPAALCTIMHKFIPFFTIQRRLALSRVIQRHSASIRTSQHHSRHRVSSCNIPHHASLFGNHRSAEWCNISPDSAPKGTIAYHPSLSYIITLKKPNYELSGIRRSGG